MIFRTGKTGRHTNRTTQRIFLRRAARRVNYLKLTSDKKAETKDSQQQEEKQDVRRV